MGDSEVQTDTPPSLRAIDTSDAWIPRIAPTCRNSSVVSMVDLYIPQNGHVYKPKHTTRYTNNSTISTQPPLCMSAHCQIHRQVYATYQLAWIQFNEGVGSNLIKCGGQESPT